MTIESVQSLEAAVASAKAAYKANKADKGLKAAVKTAKQALADGQAAAAAEEAKAAKKAAKKAKKRGAAEVEAPAAKKAKVVDVAALQAAMKAAKKAHKSDKANAQLKTAYKEAKAAFEAASTEAPEAAEAAAPVAMEEAEEEEAAPVKKAAGNAPANPTGTSKLFCGNLSFDIDDDAIRAFFADCGTLTDIFWLSDRESGRFKGCGFVTFSSADEAALGYGKNGEEVMGREVKLDYAQPKPERAGGGAGKARPKREMSEKPEGCVSCFCGNLSYEIDDDAMKSFAANCGDIKAIRWLTDRDSGDFKGCGFVEFYNSESVDEFVKLNGSDCLGRAIRIDYAAARAAK